MTRRRPSTFSVISWILVFVMALYVSLVIVPDAQASTPPKPRARLLLEIRDERLRVFEYETDKLMCHISVIDVKMIGSQASITCVRKDDQKAYPERRLFLDPSR